MQRLHLLKSGCDGNGRRSDKIKIMTMMITTMIIVNMVLLLFTYYLLLWRDRPGEGVFRKTVVGD